MAVKRITDEEKPAKEPKKLGRPSVVTPELVRKAWQYTTNWKRTGDVIPMAEGLAIYLHIHKDTLYAHEEFSDVLNAIKTAQAHALANGSLGGYLNPVISKLILASKHNYVEKSAVDATAQVTHKYEKLDDEELDRAIKAREDRIS